MMPVSDADWPDVVSLELGEIESLWIKFARGPI
jgi:hypothetical protein